ncbi:hypothetical protein BGZ95_008447, partial [Linnemannia exigua]
QLGDANKQLDDCNKKVDDANKQLGDANLQLGDANKKADDCNKQLDGCKGDLTKTNDTLTACQDNLTTLPANITTVYELEMQSFRTGLVPEFNSKQCFDTDIQEANRDPNNMENLTSTCNPGAVSQEIRFVGVRSNCTIRSRDFSLCLTLEPGLTAGSSTSYTFLSCKTPQDPYQQWSIEPSGDASRVRNAATGKCLGAYGYG